MSRPKKVTQPQAVAVTNPETGNTQLNAKAERLAYIKSIKQVSPMDMPKNSKEYKEAREKKLKEIRVKFEEKQKAAADGKKIDK